MINNHIRIEMYSFRYYDKFYPFYTGHAYFKGDILKKILFNLK